MTWKSRYETTRDYLQFRKDKKNGSPIYSKYEKKNSLQIVHPFVMTVDIRDTSAEGVILNKQRVNQTLE